MERCGTINIKRVERRGTDTTKGASAPFFIKYLMKVLIVASGKTATQIKDIDTADLTVVAVNNGYKATNNIDIWFRSIDFHFENESARPFPVGDPREIYDIEDILYTHFGSPNECGFAVVLAASYWVLHTFKPTEIYYLGCDMNYERSKDGSTAFYGIGHDIAKNGIADPLTMANKYKDPDQTDDEYIQQIYLRFKHIAEEYGCSVWNASKIDETKTRLPYPTKLII